MCSCSFFFFLKCQATDRDSSLNGQVSYSLQESPNTLKLLNKNSISNRLFAIDQNGWITLVSPLNLPKSLTSYELIVIARDAGDIPLETNALVLISIQSTNSYNLPKISVLILNDNNQAEVNESARIGEIVARITIKDDDEQINKINYQLNLEELNDNSSSVQVLNSINKFKLRELDRNTYLLIVNERLDREQQEYFNLKLTAFSRLSMNCSEMLRLKISDSNDNRPYFEHQQTKIQLNQYSEVDTLVYTFSALDNDLPSTNQFTFTLDETRSDRESLNWFDLNQSTGKLKVKQRLNCNLNKNPLIVISVNDGLNEGESANLIIELQSNNDYVPVFERQFYNVSVDENSAIDYCFLTLIAQDQDCGLNSSIQFNLIATNRADLPLTSHLSAFQLNKTSGELCISSKLDYEQRTFYELIVMASNLNGLNSTSIVHIYIDDANDHEPHFQTNQYKVNVHENIVPLNNGIPAPIVIVKGKLVLGKFLIFNF